jgi:hypothetical protein
MEYTGGAMVRSRNGPDANPCRRVELTNFMETQSGGGGIEPAADGDAEKTGVLVDSNHQPGEITPRCAGCPLCRREILKGGDLHDVLRSSSSGANPCIWSRLGRSLPDRRVLRPPCCRRARGRRGGRIRGRARMSRGKRYNGAVDTCPQGLSLSVVGRPGSL